MDTMGRTTDFISLFIGIANLTSFDNGRKAVARHELNCIFGSEVLDFTSTVHDHEMQFNMHFLIRFDIWHERDEVGT
jgi:hypothetical protein